jgi:hypothetical protein
MIEVLHHMYENRIMKSVTNYFKSVTHFKESNTGDEFDQIHIWKYNETPLYN